MYGGVVMKVMDVMTKNVATVGRDESIKKVAELMSQYNIGSIPVCENDKVVGVITDRDIALRCVAKGLDNNIKVSDVMTSNPVMASKDMDIHDAARIMSERQIRRLPVEDNENVVGIVSLGDIAIEPNHEDEAQKALSDISEQNN